MRARPVVALALLLGAACIRYTPQPVDVEAVPEAYRARTLDDPALRADFDSLGTPLRGDWDAWHLAQAAWFLAPERARHVAELHAAQASLAAEGLRPAPGLAAQSEIDFSGKDGSEPWALGLSGLYRIELGGKRGARVARAQAALLTAGARLAEAREARVWEMRRLLVERTARRLVREAEDSLAYFDVRVQQAVDRRHAAGAIGTTEVTLSRSAIAADRVAVAASQRYDAELDAVISARLGTRVPPFRPPPVPACEEFADPEGASLDSLGRLALVQRAALGRVLAAYQEAEGDLRLTAAASWPDLEFGPGLLFDHGVGKWTIGFGLPTLPRGARAAVRAAEARREVAAAQVAEVQLGVLGEVREAVLRCAAVRRLVRELTVQNTDAWHRYASALAAVERGEAEPWVADEAAVQRARLLRDYAQARVDEALAQLDLERAVGTWQRKGGAP